MSLLIFLGLFCRSLFISIRLFLDTYSGRCLCGQDTCRLDTDAVSVGLFCRSLLVSVSVGLFCRSLLVCLF